MSKTSSISGPLTHYDLVGVWDWPRDVREQMCQEIISKVPGLTEEAKEKITKHYNSGKLLFLIKAEIVLPGSIRRMINN